MRRTGRALSFCKFSAAVMTTIWKRHLPANTSATQVNSESNEADAEATGSASNEADAARSRDVDILSIIDEGDENRHSLRWRRH